MAKTKRPRQTMSAYFEIAQTMLARSEGLTLEQWRARVDAERGLGVQEGK